MKSSAIWLLMGLVWCQGVWAQEHAASMKPADALKALQAGNQRFLKGTPEHPRGDTARVKETAGAQHPIAVVIGCSDSRVPPEILFDQGIGDLFVVRVAGNVCAAHEIGSAEYATEHLGTPLVVVLGHTSCGAVTAAVAGGEVPDNVRSLLDGIRPAVAKAEHEHPELKGKALIPAAAEANAWNAAQRIFELSPTIRHLVKEGKLQVVVAMYDVGSGVVRWLGDAPVAAQDTARAHDAPAPAAPPARTRRPRFSGRR
jgi:carbonic anhydrase